MQQCEIGGRFSRCANAPVQTCQYCGRRFCQAHTYFSEGHEAVCTRKYCRAKRDDMVVHADYRAEVERLNRSGRCGVDGCADQRQSQCSLCQGQFCESHIALRSYPFYDGHARIERMAAVCPRCWQRRKVWRRVR